MMRSIIPFIFTVSLFITQSVYSEIRCHIASKIHNIDVRLTVKNKTNIKFDENMTDWILVGYENLMSGFDTTKIPPHLMPHSSFTVGFEAPIGKRGYNRPEIICNDNQTGKNKAINPINEILLGSINYKQVPVIHVRLMIKSNNKYVNDYYNPKDPNSFILLNPSQWTNISAKKQVAGYPECSVKNDGSTQKISCTLTIKKYSHKKT